LLLERCVEGDLVQPGLDAKRRSSSLQCLVRARKGGLCDVFPARMVAQHAAAVVGEWPRVPAIQLVECVSIAGGDRADELLVRPSWLKKCAHAAVVALVLVEAKSAESLTGADKFTRTGEFGRRSQESAREGPLKGHDRKQETLTGIQCRGDRTRPQGTRRKSSGEREKRGRDFLPGRGPFSYVRTDGVKDAPSTGNFGGIDVPTGVPISPPQTINDLPVHATRGPLRERSGHFGNALHRFAARS
jgi:hypothetical protein